MNYLVCTVKPWNIAEYGGYSQALPGSWQLITERAALTLEAVEALAPRYIFFPHWSWIVPDSLLERYECVCFHAADVPYGRGGSPVQNLIIRGHQETKVTALRMVRELDAGPVYFKRPLSLQGRGQEIFAQLAQVTGEMIGQIVREEPVPQPQTGEPVVFKRRTPKENILPAEGGVADVYNHIRMLDVETYPPSHLVHGKFKLSFRHATLEDGKVRASVEIEEVPNG